MPIAWQVHLAHAPSQPAEARACAQQAADLLDACHATCHPTELASPAMAAASRAAVLLRVGAAARAEGEPAAALAALNEACGLLDEAACAMAACAWDGGVALPCEAWLQCRRLRRPST